MSKAFILETLRKNIPADLKSGDRQAAVDERLTKTPKGVLPAMPRTRIKQINHFIEKVEASQASIEQVSRRYLAQAVAGWLRDHNLPAEIRMGNDKRLEPIRSDRKNSLTIKGGPSDGHDLVGLSHAEYGIVETGTLALFSGPDNPTTLNFLPENHIVVVNQSDILPNYEEIWPLLRERYGQGVMPRAVNLITGPSRSADIEQTLLLGAHGPVRLHVILVRD